MPRRVAILAAISAIAAGGGQEPESRPKREPLQLVLASADDAASGILVAADDEAVTLLTDRGEQSFRWENLRPYSAWRARSALAGREGGKRLQLAEFCREHKLFRQARWEFAAARSIDPAATVPDLEELRKLDAEAFLPGAQGMAPAAIAKQLEKELAEAVAARAAGEKKRQEDKKRELGVADVATLVWKGDSSRRLDIVLACDGFAQADQAKFVAIADQLVKAFMKVEPMANYPSYINFHRISIVEAKS